MIDENCVYLTQSTLVRGLSKRQFNVLVDVSLKLNDLRNCAVKTTSLVKSSDGKHYKKINYQSVIGKVKKSFKAKFSIIQAHIAGACIKKHVDSFNGCVELKNKKMDKNYDHPVICRMSMMMVVCIILLYPRSLLLLLKRNWKKVILNYP